MNEMHIFVSWSGERSKKAAQGLRSLMEGVFPDAIRVFISDDIGPGENWAQRIGVELEQSQFGVLCLTQENYQAPWLLFEAGALAKKFGIARVVPYRIDELPEAADRSPISQFQRVRADRHGTYQLIQAINNSRENPRLSEKLEKSFEKWWPDLKETLEGLPAPAHQPSTLRPDRHILEEILEKVFIIAEAQSKSQELPRPELTHLLNLRDQPTTQYRTRGILKEQMRHLRDLGYINNAAPIHSLPDEFELGRLFSLTEKGKNLLKQYESQP